MDEGFKFYQCNQYNQIHNQNLINNHFQAHSSCNFLNVFSYINKQMSANKILDESDSEDEIKLDQIKLGMPESNELFPRKPIQTRPLQATGAASLSDKNAKITSNVKLPRTKSLEVDLALQSKKANKDKLAP